MLAERGRWLAGEPERYAALTPEGEPLLAEFSSLCAKWGVAQETTVRALGAALEADFLLLSPDASGAFRLRGGALCFPTGWALEEKLGHTLDFIHGGVPGLNGKLAAPIQQFLARMKPGVAYLRENWGMAATDALNLHPARGIPAPAPQSAPDRLWLRVENQVLVALPRSGGAVFGVRIELHRMDEIIRNAPVAAGLRRALETMPLEMAIYKRLNQVRGEIVSWL